MFVVEAEFMYIKQAHFCSSQKEAENTAKKLAAMGATGILINDKPFVNR